MLPRDHRHKSEQDAIERSNDGDDDAAHLVVLHEIERGETPVQVPLRHARTRRCGTRRPHQQQDGVHTNQRIRRNVDERGGARVADD